MHRGKGKCLFMYIIYKTNYVFILVFLSVDSTTIHIYIDENVLTNLFSTLLIFKIVYGFISYSFMLLICEFVSGEIMVISVKRMKMALMVFS